MLQCFAARRSVLRSARSCVRVNTFSSVLQSVAAWCSESDHAHKTLDTAVCCSGGVVWCSVLQLVAVCQSICSRHHVAMRCTVLQRVKVCQTMHASFKTQQYFATWEEKERKTQRVSYKHSLCYSFLQPQSTRRQFARGRAASGGASALEPPRAHWIGPELCGDGDPAKRGVSSDTFIRVTKLQAPLFAGYPLTLVRSSGRAASRGASAPEPPRAQNCFSWRGGNMCDT